jgi:hypothetical protein
MTLRIVPEILIPQLYLNYIFILPLKVILFTSIATEFKRILTNHQVFYNE